VQRSRKTNSVKSILRIVGAILVTIGLGQSVVFADIAPERCTGYGDVHIISQQNWDAGLGSWTVGTHNVTNPGTFSTPDWAVVSSLPDSRPGAAAFVADQNNGNCSSEDKSGALTLTSPTIPIPGGMQVPRISIDHWFVCANLL